MTNARIALVGNPNSGKSTIFNALTGGHQRVGNWSGVTVACQQGSSICAGLHCDIIDLPGTYSLTHPETGAMDEAIACQFLLAHPIDLIVNVVDASHLERHLYLTSQLLELGVPVVVVLNMMDLAAADDIVIDSQLLSQTLQCDVISMNAYKGDGLTQLQSSIASPLQTTASSQRPWLQFSESIERTLTALRRDLDLPNRAQAIAVLEQDYHVLTGFDEPTQTQVIAPHIAQCAADNTLDVDLLIADERYQQLRDLVKKVTHRRSDTMALNSWRSRLDNIVLNRVLGLPIFLLVMYLMFFFAINVGGIFQDFFDITSDVIFVQGLTQVLQAWHCPAILTTVLTVGIGKSINTTLTFIPIIMAMFFFLSFLEDSGYMARAAFIIDRIMRCLGLPGKSFVPMIVGFGCNVPAVMAARTLESYRDRVLTIMMNPFMSCSARLAIYAIFTAAFFPQGGQNVVFALYLTGIVMAILTGFLLRHTILSGDLTPLILELPAYHVPSFQGVWYQTWHRTKAFLFRAGKVIVPVCVLIGLLGAIDTSGHVITPAQQERSVLATVGRAVTPIFHPMGIHEDNWPATVGLFTGVLAKEVVVASLNTLYMEASDLPRAGSQPRTMATRLRDAWLTIPAHLRALPTALLNPVLGALPESRVSQGMYGVMVQRFAGPASALAYLLFVLLYIPCVSTIAVIARELNGFWAVLSLTWNTALAYGVAVGFYQLVTTTMPIAVLGFYLFAALVAVLLLFFSIKQFNRGGRHELSRLT